MAESDSAGILMLVRFKSKLPIDELTRRYQERMPRFRELPGLVQKYYVSDPSTGEIGGLYVWQSQEALQEYLAGDLRKTIPEAYEIVGEPRILTLDLLETLREG